MASGDYRIVERNLRAAMGCFARSTHLGEAVELPGLQLVYSAISHAVFNSAMLTEPVLGIGDLRRRLDRAQDFFRRRQQAWSLWLCEDWIEPDLRAAAINLIQDFHLTFSSNPPGMFAPELRAPQHALPTLEMVPIRDITARMDFCHVMSKAFEGPFAVLLEAYQDAAFWNADFAGWIGYRDGQAIATACTVTDNTSIGVYAVATVPAEQGKGYGETMVRHAVEAARAHSGLQASVLQSSVQGMPLYRRLGYRPVADFTIHISR
ncbi:MAG: GNAT family N-acetyltransferase [Bryobacteraceae bacterium]|nr:GNAT family N-acetyltransferase [Bryobacteraceae bacterium]